MQSALIKRISAESGQVFIIAEAGVNHNGNLLLAKKLIKAAKSAGADAVKFQTYKAEEIAASGVKMLDYQKRSAFGSAKGRAKGVKTQLEMLKSLELDKGAHLKLLRYAKKTGITFLSTPGDFLSVDLLEELKVPLFKIGSDDLTNLPLLKYVASKNKPILLSTGMANLKEIKEALRAIREAADLPVVLMHATTLYPCPLQDVNMRSLLTLKNKFRLPVGYSDHSAGISAAMAAVSLGARVIEKHLTLDRSLPGPDQAASYQPEEFKVFVKLIREVEACLGSAEKKPTPGEKAQMPDIRKSIVAKRDIAKGSLLEKEDLAIKRPAVGLAPKDFYRIIGMKLKRDILKDQPVKSRDLF